MKLNASLLAGTSLNCRGRKLCGSLSRRHDVQPDNKITLIRIAAMTWARRRSAIKGVPSLPAWIFDLQGAENIQVILGMVGERCQRACNANCWFAGALNANHHCKTMAVSTGSGSDVVKVVSKIATRSLPHPVLTSLRHPRECLLRNALRQS